MTERGTMQESDFHALVDGELDAERAAEVERLAAETAETAARLTDYRTLNDELHAAFDPVLDEPMPESIRRALRAAPGHRPAGRWRRVAAGLLIFAAGSAVGWGGAAWLRAGDQPARQIAAAALGAHQVFSVEVRHPVEVAATEEDHLVKWLSKRLGADIRAPHLAAAGYRLVGGRLLAEGEAPAAQFMYENETGQRLTLYIRRHDDGDDTAFRFAEQGAVAAFYWIDKPLAYAIVGTLGRADLQEVARMVYGDLIE